MRNQGGRQTAKLRLRKPNVEGRSVSCKSSASFPVTTGSRASFPVRGNGRRWGGRGRPEPMRALGLLHQLVLVGPVTERPRPHRVPPSSEPRRQGARIKPTTPGSDSRQLNRGHLCALCLCLWHGAGPSRGPRTGRLSRLLVLGAGLGSRHHSAAASHGGHGSGGGFGDGAHKNDLPRGR